MIPPMSRAKRVTLVALAGVVVAAAALSTALVLGGGQTGTNSRPGTAASAQPSGLSDLRAFDLPTTTQARLSIGVVAGGGGDVTSVSQLSSSAAVKNANTSHGFLGEHTVTYAATGLDPANPEAWPVRASGAFLTGLDLFPSAADATAMALVHRDDLVGTGFQVVPIAPIGPGESIVQQVPAGSTLLTTIVNIARGPVLIRVASSCHSCPAGTVPDAVTAFVKAQVDLAVLQGLPSG